MANNVFAQYNGGFLPDILLLTQAPIVWFDGIIVAYYYCVQYDVGLLPDIILLTQCYYHHGRTRLNAMKRFCLCSL